MGEGAHFLSQQVRVCLIRCLGLPVFSLPPSLLLSLGEASGACCTTATATTTRPPATTRSHPQAHTNHLQTPTTTLQTPMKTLLLLPINIHKHPRTHRDGFCFPYQYQYGLHPGRAIGLSRGPVDIIGRLPPSALVALQQIKSGSHTHLCVQLWVCSSCLFLLFLFLSFSLSVHLSLSVCLSFSLSLTFSIQDMNFKLTPRPFCVALSPPPPSSPPSRPPSPSTTARMMSEL